MYTLQEKSEEHTQHNNSCIILSCINYFNITLMGSIHVVNIRV